MAELKTVRRYYLKKRFFARQQLDEEGLWIGKQEAEPGVALPATFPHIADLTGFGYTTIEDLDGADEFELTCVGLSTIEAKAVLVALAPLV